MNYLHKKSIFVLHLYFLLLLHTKLAFLALNKNSILCTIILFQEQLLSSHSGQNYHSEDK